MIEVVFCQPVTRTTKVDTSNLLPSLNNLLDKMKFYGTITLKYEQGELKTVRAEQTFTRNSLIDYLNS